MKIELLPFEYTMFHLSRFRNTSALLYLHITTTVFRCVSTVCKHLGYARANIVFFHYFFVFKNKLNNKEKSGSIYQYFNWTRCPLFCQQVCWLLFMTISLLLLFIWIQMMEFINYYSYKFTAFMLAGNGEQIWHIDNVFICFLGKTGEMWTWSKLFCCYITCIYIV